MPIFLLDPSQVIVFCHRTWKVEPAELQLHFGLRVPEEVIESLGQCLDIATRAARPRCLSEHNLANEVLAAENLVHQRADEMHVLVADLDEDAAALGEQVAGGGEAVAQVAE